MTTINKERLTESLNKLDTEQKDLMTAINNGQQQLLIILGRKAAITDLIKSIDKLNNTREELNHEQSECDDVTEAFKSSKTSMPESKF